MNKNTFGNNKWNEFNVIKIRLEWITTSQSKEPSMASL